MVELVIIGGGPAGLAAAYSAWQHGLRDILILERDAELGGILNQCIHNGFGLHRFGQQLTGPEYAGRYIEMLRTTGVRVELGTMVLEVTPDKQVHCVSRSKGYQIIQAKSIILCMGCRERTRGAIGTPGTRPAGIYTAGAAQRYVNMEGYLVGRRVLILGSGDIGLIMARRMTFEGVKVKAVFEIMPYSNGLTRNIVQCLEDFGIPLYLGHSVTAIHGKDRVTGVTVSQVNDRLEVIDGTAFDVSCDCVLLSVGLIPENELSCMAGVAIHPVTNGPVMNEFYQTTRPSIFAAGNVVIVYDLADWVSQEGFAAGRNAALYAAGSLRMPERRIEIRGGKNVRLFSPQAITGSSDAVIYFRVARPIEKRCRVFADHGLFEQKHRYVRPGEMNEIRLAGADLRALPETVTTITIDAEEA